MQPIDPNDFDPTGELAQQIEAQRREYGTYVAWPSRIYAGNALAYDVGHPVPVSNVVKHGYWHNKQVALVEGAEHAPEVAATIEATTPAPDPTPDPPPGVSIGRTATGAPAIDEVEKRF